MADIAAPSLKRLSLPSTVDLSKGSQSFQASVEVADEAGGSGVNQVTVWFDKDLAWPGYRSQLLQFGGSWMSDNFADATPHTASHQFTLDAKTPSGTYTVKEVWVTDAVGNRATYDTQQLQAMGAAIAITVTGKPVDSAGPRLASLGLPASVDLSAGDVSLSVRAEAHDNEGGSGVRYVMLDFDQPLTLDGSRGNLLLVGIAGDNFDDGTPNHAARGVVLGQATAPGAYRVLQARVIDNAGNETRYSAHELEALGVSTTLTVTGSALDAKAPELLALSLPRTVALDSNEKQFAAALAQDEGKGVSGVYLKFDRALAFSNGASDVMAIGAFASQDNFRDATPGMGAERFMLTGATAPGDYRIEQAWLYDAAGNSTTYTAEQLQQRGIHTSISVVGGAPPAKVGAGVEGGMLFLSFASKDWAAANDDATSLTIKYDTSQGRYLGAYFDGAPALAQGSVTESGKVGSVTLVTYGAIPVDAVLKVALQPHAPGVVQYVVDSFTVNGVAQAFGGGRVGAVSIGSAGADSFEAGLASPIVDGQGGLDRIVFDGWKDGYTIGRQGKGLVVENASGLRLELANIERIVFDDRTLALDTSGAAGQMYRLYQAAFDRKPSEYELGFWMKKTDGGTSLHRIADAFVLSQEFDALYGANASAETFVAALYDNVLHRTPDPGGVAFWVNAVKAGADRADVLIQFSESAENVAQVIASIQDGVTYST